MTIRRFKDLKIERLICNLLIVTALCLLLPTILFAQIDTAWVRRYNGPGNDDDWANDIAIDAQGNIYITGYTYSSLTYSDYATIKYNSDGNLLWAQCYNGPGNDIDIANAIALDNVGNVYVTGQSYGDSTTRYDIMTIKYNTTGTMQWVTRYNGPGNNDDNAYDIKVDAQGYVYIAGVSHSDSVNTEDFTTIKYNPNGDTAWVRRYNGSGNWGDQATALAVDGQGNVYVTGRSNSTISWFDITTIKYNSIGDTVWVRVRIGEYGPDCANAIAVDSSGNVFVTGVFWDDIGTYTFLTIKYNSAGNIIWQRMAYAGSAQALAIDGQGNVYVTGYSGGFPNSEYTTIKYNSAGVQLWDTIYNGSGNDEDRAAALALDGQSNVYVTGYSTGSGTGKDYATIKYDSNGVQQWVARYNGPGNDEDMATAIAVDGYGNVYVTGRSYGTNDDYVTIKYIQTAAIEENRLLLSTDHSSLEIYPNPAKSVLRIRAPLSVEEIKIFEVSGKLVKVANEVNGARSYKHEMKISLKGINPGIYFLKLDKETKKFLVVK